MSLAHELSGLGSTRVVRFSVSARRRIDEPDDVATGSQDEKIQGCVEPMGEEGTVGIGGERVAGDFGAAVPPLPDRYEEEGLAGLADKRLGKASARRVPVDEIAWMLDQYRSQYWGWNVKHFHEHLQKHHGFSWGYTWVKTQLHAAGLVERAKRRGAHRRKRPRKPCEGMMLHQDGSRAEWLAGSPPLDLIVTMDDATSTVYSAFLVEEEGTASTFRACLEVFAMKGLPSSLYTDRGSHYFFTPKAGQAVDKEHLTQVGRALDRLGIEHIAAYSPEARGRSERMFGTLQDRLAKELKLAGNG